MQPVLGLKCRLLARRGLGVVGTDLLTDVAPEDVIANQWPQFGRDAPLKLDRQIGDAAAGIQPRRADEGVCGAGLETKIARAAPVLDRPVSWKREAQEQLAEEKPGPLLRGDEMGVFPDPSDPGPAGELPFQHRPGIDVHPTLDYPTNPAPNPGQERIKPAFQKRMVIVSPCIPGDPSPGRARRSRLTGKE